MAAQKHYESTDVERDGLKRHFSRNGSDKATPYGRREWDVSATRIYGY